MVAESQTKFLRPLRGLLALALSCCFGLSLAGAEEPTHFPLEVPTPLSWSFTGPWGSYDRAQLQRGLKVYKEACAACHSLHYVHFRDLRALGYTNKQVQDFAATFSIKDGINKEGTAVLRKGRLTDVFPEPFENDIMASLANNGAVPPDLSTIALARSVPEGVMALLGSLFTSQAASSGADYMVALLTGYSEPPKGVSLAPGNFYNPYFISGQTLSMPPVLSDNLIVYTDGTPQTMQQYAEDVAAFLRWCADPHMEQRKKLGFCVLGFLLLMCVILFLLKREIFNTLEKEE